MSGKNDSIKSNTMKDETTKDNGEVQTTNSRENIAKHLEGREKDTATKIKNAEATRQAFVELENRSVQRLHPIANRIVEAMEYKSQKTGTKITWNGLAQALLLSPGAPTNWKKGKISKETLKRIAGFTGVDFAWLVTGEGEISKELNNARTALGYIGGASIGSASMGLTTASGGLIAGSLGLAAGPIGLAAGAIAAGAMHAIGKKIQNTKLQKALDDLEIENPELVEEIKQEIEEAVEKAAEKTITENIQKTTESGIRLVPLISFVQAGSFKEAILNAQDQFVATYASNLGKSAFALEIVGDSMLPDFKPKDKIIVDPDVTPIPGDFVIAQNGDAEATFKKYKPRGYDEKGKEYFELVALNDDYPTLDSRFQDIQIIATVIDHIRNLRR